MMRIVVLTNQSRRGIAVLAALKRRNLPIAAIVIDRGKLNARDKMKRTRQTWRRNGPADTMRRIKKRLWRSLDRRSRSSDKGAYTQFTNHVHFVADANGDECTKLLRELAPDVIVLGASRILRPHIIEIPRTGILNTHPGLLPQYRGNDIILWALHNNDPLGVTVHFVDAGIDTGAIVAQRQFEPIAGDTLQSLERRANELVAELVADVVEQLDKTGHVTTERQPSRPGHLYTRMPPALRRQVESKLAARWDHQDVAARSR